MAVVEISDLRKRFGSVPAVNGLSFEIEAGRVTGFLGPNGAEKSTTLRALLVLVRPTAGTATFEVAATRSSSAPAPRWAPSSRMQLFIPAARRATTCAYWPRPASTRPDASTRSCPPSVSAIPPAAGSRATRWACVSGLRSPPLCSGTRVSSGRAVLISSHLLAEVAQSVDDVVVIAGGELRGHGTLEQVLGGTDDPATEVRAQDPERLARALQGRGHDVERDGEALLVLGATPEQVGEIAAAEQVVVLGLAPRARSLEAAFFALTGNGG